MVGDGIDFWRVLKVEPPRRLLLLAEMKAPGEALLYSQIKPAATIRLNCNCSPDNFAGYVRNNLCKYLIDVEIKPSILLLDHPCQKF